MWQYRTALNARVTKFPYDSQRHMKDSKDGCPKPLLWLAVVYSRQSQTSRNGNENMTLEHAKSPNMWNMSLQNTTFTWTSCVKNTKFGITQGLRPSLFNHIQNLNSSRKCYGHKCKVIVKVSNTLPSKSQGTKFSIKVHKCDWMCHNWFNMRMLPNLSSVTPTTASFYSDEHGNTRKNASSDSREGYDIYLRF
jgi:hypothetical protein